MMTALVLYQHSNRGNLTEYGYMEDESRDFVVNLTQATNLFGYETDIKVGAAYNEKERSSYYLTYHYNMGQVTNRDCCSVS